MITTQDPVDWIGASDLTGYSGSTTLPYSQSHTIRCSPQNKAKSLGIPHKITSQAALSLSTADYVQPTHVVMLF